MASTFSQQITALADVSDAIVAARAKMAQGKQIFIDAGNDLAKLGADYGGIFGDIATAAAAAPSNVALQNCAAEATALTSEFTSLTTVGTNTIAAAAI